MAEENRKHRNGEIDFLRFVFAIVIVLHHTRLLVGDDQCLFLGGSLAVEFFFIVSGYLMMATIEKASYAQNALPLGKETQRFLARKLSALLPELLLAQGIAWLFSCYALKKTIRQGIALFVDSFWDLSLARMTGLLTGKMNGCTWYLSSMLLCMAVLYPLLRKYKDMMVHVVLPLFALTGMGFLCMQYGSPRDPSNWIGWTFKGNIRAFCELSLGALCFYAAGWLAKVPLNGLGRLAATVAEVSFYAAVIAYMYVKKPTERDYFYILLLLLAITVTFSGQSLLQRFFQNRFSFFLGKFSLSVYFSHLFYAQHLKKVLTTLDQITIGGQITIYVGISLLTAAAVYAAAAWIRKEETFSKMARPFLQKKAP